MEGPLDILCDRHVIPMLMYVYDSGGCLKSDLYGAVSRNSNIPKKLDRMASEGLITMDSGRNTAIGISLTPKGTEVASMLRSIEDVLSAQKP